jgi:TolB-like protein/Tfp pilus assembly protein PilF
MAFPLPDKPSIAVLPFNNLSGDPEQEYFSDGLTEEIISALSRVPKLFVIARNSSFTYKGKPVKVQQVSEELGVRYVLEGSVKKAGDEIRITAQLIDALTGHHLWAGRYDRNLSDLFAVQDEITKEIISAMQVKLTEGEQARAAAKGTNNLEAYLKYLQAKEYANVLNIESNALARQLAEEAIALDPEYAMAYKVLGRTHIVDVWFGTSKSPKDSMAKARELVQKAIVLDDTYAEAYALLGFLFVMAQQDDKAIALGEKAVALNPNSADAHFRLGKILSLADNRYEESIPEYKKAIRLNPIPPNIYLYSLGLAYASMGQYEEGIVWCEKAVRQEPDSLFARIMMTVVYSYSERDEEARVEAAEVLRLNPKFSLEKYEKKFSERMISALRKAGLPNKPPLPLPDKPSIAVLAFDNMSADPKQEYLADGITEHIIFALSKISKLFVIARHSSFTYKGKPVKVQQIGRELGVRYVLEGSVQKSGDRLRITAKLIDAISGVHLWSESYVRELRDLFAVQDDITKNIITAIQVKLTEGEQARATAKGTNNLDAYLKCLQANELIHQVNPESNALGKQLAEEAIALDPEYAWAYYNLGRTHQLDVWLRTSKSPKKSIGKAIGFIKKAIALDDTLAVAHGRLGFIYSMIGQYDKAVAQGEKAVAVNPNSAMAHVMLGKTLSFAGRWEESIPPYKKAIRLNPIPPSMYLYSLGLSYAFTGQYEEARTWCEKAVHQAPDALYARIMMTVVYSWSGQDEKARVEAAEVLRIQPKYTIKKSRYKRKTDRERFTGALRKAGLK